MSEVLGFVFMLQATFALGWICSDLRRDYVWRRDYERRHPK